MGLAFRTTKERDRWYPLIPTPEQIALVTDDVRFKVVPAGRRSGKTERAKRFLIKTALAHVGLYFAAAPTSSQAKKIWWDDLKLMSFASLQPRKANESELIIFLANGSQLHVIGLDAPERIEGTPWAGGMIDEIANIKAHAWEANIKPSLDTFNPLRPDYRAWCWLIGVPDGYNHYYDLYQYAVSANDPEWKGYTWFSSDILPAETIAAAKRSMSSRQYRQEYEASFESASGRIYEEYSPSNHTDTTIMPHEQLWWSHDQNYTPLSSCVAVERADGIYFLDEIVLTSAVSEQSAFEFVEKFREHKNKTIKLFGDPAGRAGEKHGHRSDYTAIRTVLSLHGWKIQDEVAKSHPSIKDRQNTVRAKILAADGTRSLYVNPVTASWCDKGLGTVQVKEGSTFQEDDRNKYQHITTAIGYLLHRQYAINHNPVAFSGRGGIH